VGKASSLVTQAAGKLSWLGNTSADDKPRKEDKKKKEESGSRREGKAQ